MFIYFLVLGIVLALALSELLLDDKRIAIATGSILGVFAGLRHYTGYDFESYGEYYQRATQLSQLFDGSVRLERGFLFLSTAFSTLGLNYYTFVLFFSLLSLGVLTYFLYKYVPYPSMVLAYYYVRFFMARDMGQVRGSFAGIILLFAIPCILKREPLKFLLIVFLASLFHISAWSFVIAYIFNLMIKKVSLKNSLLFLGISTVIGIFLQVPDLFLWTIPSYARSYFTNPYYTSGPWIFYPILWMQLLLFFGMMYFVHYTKPENKEWINLLMKIYLLAPCILLAAGPLETVGGRISGLFVLVEALLIPHFFLSLTRYKLINILCYFGFALVIFMLIFVIGGMYNRYTPYETIFS